MLSYSHFFFLLIFWKNAWFNCEALIFIPLYVYYICICRRKDSLPKESPQPPPLLPLIVCIYLFGTSFGYAIIFMLSFSNPSKRHLFLFIYTYLTNLHKMSQLIFVLLLLFTHAISWRHDSNVWVTEKDKITAAHRALTTTAGPAEHRRPSLMKA